MFLIINKKANSNQWDYPETPELFINGFRDNSNLIADYQGAKTALELGLTEYSGELPADPNAIRLITTGAFRKRFSDVVRKLIRDSVIDPVIILREDLESASYVDLDDQEVIDGLAGFSSAGLGWMTDEEITAQLADGTTKEKYNGVL